MADQGNPETGLAFLRVLWNHRKILLFCTFANIGAAMYGFDNLTLSLCLSMNPFLEDFGTLVDGTYAIPAYWQSLWNALAQIATGLGAYSSGLISDRLGRKASFLIAAVISAAGVAVVYTANGSPGQFLGGKMLNALGLGLALTAGQTYVSEITPTAIRGVALSAYTMSMNVGYMVAASVAFKRIDIPDRSGYKVLFAAEWVWPGLLLLAVFIPESPYHLVRKDKMDAASAALKRLYSANEPTDEILNSIKSIIDHESYIAEKSSFIECFRGVNWRRTRIVLYANGLSQMIGATFMSNAPYFMIVAGMSASNNAMLVEMGIGLAIISSAFTFWAMTVIGRRKMIMGGTGFACTLFFIMGIASSVPSKSSSALWCVGISLQLVWLSIGPAIGPAMALAGESSAVKLRSQTMAIGFLFNYLYSTLFNVVVPYMFNTDAGNLGGKTAWVFFATSLIAIVIVWFEFPETKGLTFSQIEDRFEMRVKAREFHKHRTDDDIMDMKATQEHVEHVEDSKLDN